LYGRNATGGAINIITSRPRFDRDGGYLDVEVGNYREFNAEGAVNLPLSDQWAVRGAFQIVNHAGYLSDQTDDGRQQGGRVEALWELPSNNSLLFQVDVTHLGGRGAGSVGRMPGIAPGITPWLGTSDPRANAAQLALAVGFCEPNSRFPVDFGIPLANLGALLNAKPPAGLGSPPACDTGGQGPGTLLASPLSAAAFQDNTIWGTHAELNWDLGFATLTAIPAFRSTRIDYLGAPIFVSYVHPETSKEATVEARLGHSSDRLKWVAGGYYLHEDQHSVADVAVGLIQYGSSIETLGNTSAAAFGEATVSISDSLRLIEGMRYTRDTKFLSGTVPNLYPSVACSDPTIPSCLSESFAGSRVFKQVTWKTGAEYDLASESMLYVTASTGYKAGGLNDSGGAVPFKSEKLLAFELGSRNRFLNDRLQINLEIFHWLYRDQQIPHVTIDVLGNPAFIYENAGRGRQDGFDLDVTAKPTASDTVHAAIEYLDSRFNQFNYSVPLTPALPPPVQGQSTGCPVTTTATASVVNCSGHSLLVAPRWVASAELEHAFRLPTNAKVMVRAEAQYASQRWLALDFLAPQELAPSYVTETVSLTYSAASAKWSLTGFVRNLSNKAVYSNGLANPFVPGGAFGATIGDPRTYGLRLSSDF
jgi:iron complex outermembrane receptor protein